MPTMKPEMHRLLAWYDRKTNKAFDSVGLADELSCCLCAPPSMRETLAKFKRKSRESRRSLALSYFSSLFPEEGA